MMSFERTSEPWTPPSFASTEIFALFVLRSPSVSARRAARCADDERRPDHISLFCAVAAVHQRVDDVIHRSAPELRDLHAYRRERRREEARDRDVVETDDGNVLRHAQAGLAKSAERAERHRVIRREDRRRPRSLDENPLSRRVTR